MNKNPEKTCFGRHGSNSTLEYHQCMCRYDYSFTRSRVKALKIKHCLEESRILKMSNFYTYIIIAAVLTVICVSLIAAFCSLKWYLETKTKSCNCCSVFCCCNKSRKKKKKAHCDDVDTFQNGYAPKNVVEDSPQPLKKGLCMRFCLSEPVQDCCEFLDCDLFWRRGTAYAMPGLGGRKVIEDKQKFYRRPSRPAPPPPKPTMLPQMKYPEPMIDDDCEPVPEAPPSPEPIRVLSPKSLYVDPLSFLQKPFMKSVEKDNHEEKPEPLYSKFKNMVMSKVRKSPSVSGVNNVGFPDANCISLSPDGTAIYNSRNLRTGSLASLHNIGDDSFSSGSKRSLSLASLHMMDVPNFMPNINPEIDHRRISVVSTATTDDIPPSARKDEYIDLEEMSKRIAAKNRRSDLNNQKSNLNASNLQNHNKKEPIYVANEMKHNGYPHQAANGNMSFPKTYTPNFIPASAFPKPTSNSNGHNDSWQISSPVQHYYPPVPASSGRPAVPARMVGSPIYTISPTSTLVKQKPLVPPRPLGIDGGRNSPQAQTLMRSPRIVKPTGPPPPPPQNANKVPIESSI